jgi:hypothetical protein
VIRTNRTPPPEGGHGPAGEVGRGRAARRGVRDA